MEWITEPSAGAEPMCNNCFFYAHGSCSTKCSSQECTIRLLADSARRTACTDCSKIFWPAAPEGRCGIAIWGANRRYL